MNANDKPLTMYVHPVTKTTKDYGDTLSVEHGIAYSWTNATCRAETIAGIEMGVTVADKLTVMRAVSEKHPNAGITFAEGNPIAISFDMNPHGLI